MYSCSALAKAALHRVGQLRLQAGQGARGLGAHQQDRVGQARREEPYALRRFSAFERRDGSRAQQWDTIGHDCLCRGHSAG